MMLAIYNYINKVTENLIGTPGSDVCETELRNVDPLIDLVFQIYYARYKGERELELRATKLLIMLYKDTTKREEYIKRVLEKEKQRRAEANTEGLKPSFVPQQIED